MPTTTRSAARTKVTTAVLTTPELLTLILSFLPPHHLLLSAQLICKTWHLLTQTQPLLRQTLFLDPSPGEPPTLNPLLVKTFPIFFRAGGFRSDDFHFLPFCRNPEAFKRRGASWRDMLPLSTGGEVRAVRRWNGWGHSSESVGKVDGEGGMKMGLCWDITRTMCKDPRAQIFWCWREEVEVRGEKIGGKYERGYEETEELEIRVEGGGSGCIATVWDEDAERAAEKAAEKEERRRKEEDRVFRCEGVGEVDVRYGEMRDTYETMRFRLMLPVYQREMELAASLPIVDSDDED